MKMVKVFKTDVNDRLVAGSIEFFLRQTLSSCRINFDLDDCDNILRIESHQESVEDEEVRHLLALYGHQCEPL